MKANNGVCSTEHHIHEECGVFGVFSGARANVAACDYGTDMDSAENLIANHHTVEEIAEIINGEYPLLLGRWGKKTVLNERSMNNNTGGNTNEKLCNRWYQLGR